MSQIGSDRVASALNGSVASRPVNNGQAPELA